MLRLFENKRVMVVAAHPDDEVLGLGATIHKITRLLKVETRAVILGEGLTSRSDSRQPEKFTGDLAIHKSNMEKAATTVGYNSIARFDFPDNRFDSVSRLDLIKVIENEKKQFRPDIIFTHHGGDLNIDHRLTFEAVITACRPLKDESVNTIITFETPSSTEWQAMSDPNKFAPNFFMTVDEVDLEAKVTAMEVYEFERRQFPHPRSPEALRIIAQRWGLVVNSGFAEAFCIVRTIAE